MVEFSVKEVALQLETSTQNIYKKLDKLVLKGLAYRDVDGHPIIYENGLNYLRNEKIKRKTVANTKYYKMQESIENNEKQEVATASKNQETVAELYKKMYEDMKVQCDFWKSKFEDKDRAYNEVTSQLLLNSAKNEDVQRKSLFARIFNK